MATISKGIKLFYKAPSSGIDGEYTEAINLMEIPDLGGSIDAIEITTLADAAHRYTKGLLNYGDSLDFKFLYDGAAFGFIQALTTEFTIMWRVDLPDGESCSFTGPCSVKLDGVGVNAALTYTLSIMPDSVMEWA